jgi:hypothetical protein
MRKPSATYAFVGSKGLNCVLDRLGAVVLFWCSVDKIARANETRLRSEVTLVACQGIRDQQPRIVLKPTQYVAAPHGHLANTVQSGNRLILP